MTSGSGGATQRNATRAKRKAQSRHFRLCFDVLEDRRLLAMTIFNISGSSAVQEPLTLLETKYVEFTISIMGMGGPPDSASVTWTASSQSGDTATADVDYQALTGTVNLGPSPTSQVIQIPIYYDVLSESNETFRVTLSNPTNGAFVMSGTAQGTIIDAPVNPMYVSITADLSQIMEGQSVNFRIARSDSQGPMTVYFEAQGTASPADYQSTPAIGSVTFADGQSEAIVAVSAIDDGETESGETLVLQLLSIAPGTQGPSQYLITGTGNAGVTILDPALPTVWAGSASPVDEGATREITFYRSTSTESLNVLFDVGGTATLGPDYSLSSSGSVTFDVGQTQAIVTLTAVADDLPEGDEVVSISIVLPSQGPAPYNIGSPGGLSVQIFDTSGYHATNFTVEWQKPDESWQLSPDSEMLWEEDLLRFTAEINSGALPFLMETQWFKRPFGSSAWELFAQSDTHQTSGGTYLFAGDWEMKVDAFFAHVVVQAPAKHRPVNGIQTAWIQGDPEQRFFYGEEDIVEYPNHYGPRVYPEKNTKADPIQHDKVKVEVTLKIPPPVGFSATVHLSARDPDHVGGATWANRFDPNDVTGDIDDPILNLPADNRVGGTSDLALGGRFNSTRTQFVDVLFGADELQKEEEFWITETQPGNNFKVAAMGRNEWLDVLFFGEDGVTLLWPRAILSPLPQSQATHIMTVWRTLHAELDVMVPPGMGFVEDEVVGDDLLRAMHELDIGFAAQQFRRAMIDLVDDLKNNDPGANPEHCDTLDGIEFIHHVDAEDQGSRDAFLTAARAKRNVRSDVPFWVVHLVAAYEGPVFRDFDPFTEDPVVYGWSNRPTQLGWLYEETIRDRAAFVPEDNTQPKQTKDAATIERRGVLHELGHLFGLMHVQNQPDHGPMNVDFNLFEDDAHNYLLNWQLSVIQQVLAPGGLLPGQPNDPLPPWL